MIRRSLPLRFHWRIGQYARRARELGSGDGMFADFAAGALFTTLTNVNFNSTRFVLLLGEADQVRERARTSYEQAARERGLEPEQLGTLVYRIELHAVNPGD